MRCTLCNSVPSSIFYNDANTYYKCENCKTVYMDASCYVSQQREIDRYTEHNNDVDDLGYQKFVQPIVTSVLSDFTTESKGLDFGCGTGPVITKLLRDKNFEIQTFDPFFDNNLEALKTTYDYIVCCEVIEHFHHPLKEFKLLKSLLKPQGKLYCMTDVYHENIDFKNWYYKNDETHVIFYSENSFNRLSKALNFEKVIVNDRLIIFQN